RLIEEIAAAGVADGPGVEIFGPGFHQRLGDLAWICDESGQPARFQNACLPELLRERMVAANAPGQRSELRYGDAKRFLCVDAELGHRGDGGRVAQRLQLLYDLIDEQSFDDRILT